MFEVDVKYVTDKGGGGEGATHLFGYYRLI